MYEVEYGDHAREQAASLPIEAVSCLLEVQAALELAPWNGEPANPDNPGGNILTQTFGPGGPGMVVYLVLEDQRRVAVLQIAWAG